MEMTDTLLVSTLPQLTAWLRSTCREMEDEIKPTKVEAISITTGTVYSLFFKKLFELDAAHELVHNNKLMRLSIDTETGSLIVSQGDEQEYDAIPADDILAMLDDSHVEGGILLVPVVVKANMQSEYILIRMIKDEEMPDINHAVDEILRGIVDQYSKMKRMYVSTDKAYTKLASDSEFVDNIRFQGMFQLTTRTDEDNHYCINRKF